MYVVLRCIRELKIYDVANPFNIQTAGSDIRRDEDAKLSVSETCQCSRSGTLAFITVNGRGRMTRFIQCPSKLVRSGFRACKHQRLIHLADL